MNTTTTAAKTKKGEYVRFKDSDTAPVWVRGDYNREDRKYEFYSFDDVNRFRSVKGTTKCFTGFTF